MRNFLFGVIATICFASCFSEKRDGQVVEIENVEKPSLFAKANNGKFCPRCKSDSTARIVYGLVSAEERNNWDSLKTELRKKREVLGGCCVMPEKNYCYQCGHKW